MTSRVPFMQHPCTYNVNLGIKHKAYFSTSNTSNMLRNDSHQHVPTKLNTLCASIQVLHVLCTIYDSSFPRNHIYILTTYVKGRWALMQPPFQSFKTTRHQHSHVEHIVLGMVNYFICMGATRLDNKGFKLVPIHLPYLLWTSRRPFKPSYGLHNPSI